MEQLRDVFHQIFQSTLPREERHIVQCLPYACFYFNPRSHERSDFLHAPSGCSISHFNPRSHERSDIDRGHIHSHFIVFQSTLPREERQKGRWHIKRDLYISIHAPTRGATPKPRRSTQNGIFQSTLPREERPDNVLKLNAELKFQSTLPREERHRPRTHSQPFYSISIHAPTRGATLLPMFDDISDDISIHAPTRGATRLCCPDDLRDLISIHAPTRGATAILHKKFVYFYTIPTINI